MKKSESVQFFLDSVDHIAGFATENELEKLTLMEQILVKVIKNKNVALSFKAEVLGEYKKINEKQLENLGNSVKSKFPNRG